MLPFLSPTGTLRGQGALRRTLLSTTAGVSLPAATYSADFKSLTAMPTWATFSRASNATMMDSVGRRVFAPNNMLQSSNDFSTSAWSLFSSTAVVTGANTITFDGGGGSGDYIYQGVGAGPVGCNLICSGTISISSGTGTIAFRDSLGGAGASPPINLTTTPTRFFWLVPGNAAIGFGIENRAGFGADGLAKTIIATNFQIEAVTYETSPRAYNGTTTAPYYGPRFGYEYRGGSWVRGGLVFEAEQRTNSVPSDINGAGWATFDATLDQPGQTIAGKTAWRQRTIVGGTPGSTIPAGASSEFWVTVSNAASGNGANPSAVSVDFKYSNHPYVYINMEFGAAANAYATVVFDLSGTTDQDPTQTAVSANGVIAYAKAKYRGNGEWRIFFVSQLTSGAATTQELTPVFGFAAAATGNTIGSFGDVVVPVGLTIPGTAVGYWLDPMLEVGNARCSQEFIPFNTTRAGELITVGDPVKTMLGSPWSFAESFRIPFSVADDFGDTLVFDDSGATNFLETSISNTGSGTYRPIVFGGGGAQIEGPALNSPTSGLSNRVAVAFGGGSVLLAGNGVQSQTVTGGANSGLTASNALPIEIGVYESGPFDAFMGWKERVDFWNSKLSSSDLAGVSA